jgi:hypothetical protein
MLTMNEDRHTSDGDLIALLDGDRDRSRRDIEIHVDSCAACSARLAFLQNRSTRVSELLRVLDTPIVERAQPSPRVRVGAASALPQRRRRRWSHPGLRAAAATLLLAGVAAASPAGRWILERIATDRGEPAPRETARLTRPPGPSLQQSQGPIVRFATESDQLVIQFDARPIAGTLVIVAGNEDQSSAQVVAGSRGEAFLLLPNELRIRNTAQSIADYRVTVAADVRQVRVKIAATAARELAVISTVPGARQIVRLGAGTGGQ